MWADAGQAELLELHFVDGTGRKRELIDSVQKEEGEARLGGRIEDLRGLAGDLDALPAAAHDSLEMQKAAALLDSRRRFNGF